MKKLLKIFAVLMLAVLTLTALVACAPNSDPAEAKAALKKNGYSVIELPTLGFGDVDVVISGTKVVEGTDGEDDKIEHITIYYYESDGAADLAWDDIKAKSDEEKEDNKSEDWVIKKSGNMIYYGTSAGVKAAR